MSKYLPAGTKVPGLVYYEHRDATGNRVSRCGEIQEYHNDTLKAFEAGQWIVSDIISGNLICLPFAKAVDANPAKVKGKYGMDLVFEIREAWQELWADYYFTVSEALTEFGPGATFAIGVADGAANYVVTKVTKTKAHVDWIGVAPDNYYDHHFGGGGVFPINDVKRYCRVGRSKLFGSVARLKPIDHRDWFDLEKADLVRRGMVPANVLKIVKKEPANAV